MNFNHKTQYNFSNNKIANNMSLYNNSNINEAGTNSNLPSIQVFNNNNKKLKLFFPNSINKNDRFISINGNFNNTNTNLNPNSTCSGFRVVNNSKGNLRFYSSLNI